MTNITLKRPCIALLALALFPLALGACSDPKAPNEVGINLGAPDTAWAAKNKEQKFGWMAAQVHPKMQQLFIDYDPDNKPFTCEDCHSDVMEQIDFKMPTDSLYALPPAGPLDDAIEFDAEISLFMVSKVTPLLNKLLNSGDGPKTVVTCFNCHPSSS
jgi:hypothetical protein